MRRRLGRAIVSVSAAPVAGMRMEYGMEQDLGTDYDEGLESTDPADTDADLGDAISDGTSNTVTGKGGGTT